MRKTLQKLHLNRVNGVDKLSSFNLKIEISENTKFGNLIVFQSGRWWEYSPLN